MFRKIPVSVSIVLIMIALALSCKNSSTHSATQKKKRPFSWIRNIIGNFSSQDSIFLDSTSVDRFVAKYPSFKTYKKDIKQFYSRRKYAYAWFDKNGIIEQSRNLYNRTKNLEYDGIEDSLPYQDRFEELMNDPEKKSNHEETELMLTSQYFALAGYVWKGLSEQESKKLGWFIPRKKMSYAAFLDTMLMKSNDEFLEDEPVNPQYEQLREQLKKYKDLEAKNDWPLITTKKKKFEEGDTGVVISQIRSRLALLGDLEDSGESNEFDASLKNAVVQFQQRHGLKDDGIIGKSMIDELNVPLSKRIDQIVVNMERSRWMPMDLSPKENYLLVNIPEFKLHVVENNKPAWDCNVIVGDTDNKTVVFAGVLKNIVFSPHWNIPESIVEDEILPEMEKDPNYLEEQQLEIVGNKNGLPVIRQKPGEENSLGLVKFMFPNTHNIYLHDSPAKELFDKTTRAFSHGCVRVSEPEKLANYLLRDNGSWDETKVSEAMHSGEEKWVNLKSRMPVYIVYFTAWVDPNGKLNFRKDIYNYDSRLAGMLIENNGSVANR
jgi:L,D-transpeptidase YcbB